MKKSCIAIFSAAVVCALSFPALAQPVAFDDFNRPDGPIGGNWDDPNNAFVIDDNRGRGLVNGGIQFMTWTGPNSIEYHELRYELDLIGRDSSNYVALMIGLGGTENLFIKLQNQVSGSNFTHYGFYKGNNNSNSGLTGGDVFGALDTPFENGRMIVWFPDPDTVQLDIDHNMNGTIDETLVRMNVLGIAGGFGTGMGIGVWNDGMFDNYLVIPGPGALVLLGLGLACGSRRRRN